MNTTYYSFSSQLDAVGAPCLDTDAVQTLWRGFTYGCGTLHLTPVDQPIFRVGQIQPPVLPEGKEYAFCVTPEGMAVTGQNEAALIRGVMALMLNIVPLCLDQGSEHFQIACAEGTDRFTLKTRMIHFCVFPETTLFALQRLLRLAAVLQYTHVVIEFWGMLKYDCLPELSWQQAYTKQQIAPLLDEARSLGMEIIPMFNMLGHASASRGSSGKHVVLDQNPRLQALFSIDGWSWNIASPKVWELMRCVRSELYALCGAGSYFHMGCDEDYHRNDPAHTAQIPRYLKQTACEILAEGRRPILWGDMMLAHDACGTAAPYYCNSACAENAEAILDALPKECIIADWQYEITKAPWITSQYLKNKGFDVICAPWFDRANCTSCLDTALQEQLFGVMLTTWHTLNQKLHSLPAFAYACGAEKGVLHGTSDINAELAALLRRLTPEQKRYEDCGWMEKQISVSAWTSC